MVIGVVQASQELEERVELNSSCQLLMRKIQETNHFLEELNQEKGRVPVATKNETQERLAALMQLYDRAKGGESMNVRDELYSLNLKSSAAAAYTYY
jgi:hypothetical protein